MKTLSPAELARRIERTLARPDATRQDIEQLCAKAGARGFHGVCVCGSRVELACSLLEDSEVKVTGLVGFPLGTEDSDAKRYETEVAITKAKSKLSKQHAQIIVNIVRGLRDSGKCEFAPTVRGCIMIAKTLKVQGITPIKSANGAFTQMCQDILASETSRVGSKTNQDRVKVIVKELVIKEVGAGKTISIERGDKSHERHTAGSKR